MVFLECLEFVVERRMEFASSKDVGNNLAGESQHRQRRSGNLTVSA